ncbi:DUF4767 domain-containing protein [Holzapfeliella sp. He02]|uniref:DUF4767 domain-containing protein n=1 Tax=Holzapfeliella saturejae TaxID=3082953 RepID=A0ABU8SHP5_9LACO
MKRKRERHNRSNIGVILIILVALIIVAIGGWPLFANSKHTSPMTNQSTVESSQITNASDAHSTSSVNTGFNAAKVEQMDNYMADFSSYMGQNYKRYYPQVLNQTKLNFYGFDITTELDQFNYYVDNTPVNFRLASPQETTYHNSDYNIVGVYSDVESAPFAGAHLYLLAIYNQKPQVLITMQNQGMPGNAMYFKHTENSNLATNFAKIYNN